MSRREKSDDISTCRGYFSAYGIKSGDGRDVRRKDEGRGGEGKPAYAGFASGANRVTTCS